MRVAQSEEPAFPPASLAKEKPQSSKGCLRLVSLAVTSTHRRFHANSLEKSKAHMTVSRMGNIQEPYIIYIFRYTTQVLPVEGLFLIRSIFTKYIYSFTCSKPFLNVFILL